jgi:hypothetical protein
MRQFLHIFFTRGEILRDLAFLGCLVFFWFAPRFADGPFGAIEQLGSRLAEQKGLAIFSIAMATIVIRVCLLWFFPVPYPQVHDEFSYLLAGDTFAHGRLTNPIHPMWLFFDTIHVNQHPTYMSKYPPAQGAVLALGQLLGSPWIGVLLSGGVMCGATLWMLQGWLPPRWALVGATLVVFKIALFSYWMNSYYGAFVPAIGGALVAGALPRVLHSWRAWHAVILGVGVAILANSRPFEGAIFCLPIFFVILVRLWHRRALSWRLILVRIVVPLCVVGILGGAFMAYYNWRGTGSALVFPYALNERTYFSTPSFSWQKMGPPLHYANPQFEQFYNVAMRQYWLQSGVNSWSKAVSKAGYIVLISVFFYLWPQLMVSLLTLGRVLRDRRVRFLMVQIALVFSSFLLVRARFNPHYTGPVVGSIFALVTQGMRHLRHWQSWGRPVGIGVTRVVVLFAVLLAPFNLDDNSRFATPDPIRFRAQFISQLDAMPGQHLVIVHYSPQHSVFREWVYNGADIDGSKVVWAREIPGVSLRPLLGYFHGRQVWVAEPDANPPRLSRYDSGALPQGS